MQLDRVYAHGRTARAGVPPVRLHDLRHGAASVAHEAGADLKTLQDLLGHSSLAARMPACSLGADGARQVRGIRSRQEHDAIANRAATTINMAWPRPSTDHDQVSRCQ